MLGLLEETTEPDLRADLCTALKIWAEEGDGTDEVVARVAREIQGQGQTMPRSMMEFLVQRQSPEAVTILEPLWVAQPVDWEPILVEIGPAAEAAALRHLGSESRGLRHSAIRVLKRVGNPGSVPALQEQLATADDETRHLLEEVIESLEADS
jgi:hypothetical protein